MEIIGEIPKITEDYIRRSIVPSYFPETLSLDDGESLLEYLYEILTWDVFVEVEIEDGDLLKDDDFEETPKEFGIKYTYELIEGALHGLNNPGEATPWDALKVSYNIFNAERPEKIMVPVTVFVGKDSFTHALTQDFAYGLLNVIGQDFELVIGNHEVTMDLLAPHYEIVPDETSLFKAASAKGSIAFDTSDVIRGIITGAQWINTDPHDYIKDIVRWNGTEYKDITF